MPQQKAKKYFNINIISGFTLIELIIVISLIAILASLAVVRWPGANINLNAEARQLASAIRYTQSLAMTQGKRYRVNLSTTNYTITDISANAVMDPVKASNLSINFSTGDTIAFTNLPYMIIAFDGNGTPYIDSAAQTALTVNASIALSNGSRTRTVSITPGTGRVIVS